MLEVSVVTESIWSVRVWSVLHQCSVRVVQCFLVAEAARCGCGWWPWFGQTDLLACDQTFTGTQFMGALNLLPEWTALLWSFLTTLKKWIECLKVKLWFRVPSPPCCLCLIPQRKSSFLTPRVCRWIRAAVFPSWGSGNKGDEASQGGTLFPRPETVSWPSQTVHEEQRNYRAADFHWSGGFLKAKETVAEGQTTNYRWWIRLFCFLFQLGCLLVSLFCLEAALFQISVTKGWVPST